MLWQLLWDLLFTNEVDGKDKADVKHRSFFIEKIYILQKLNNICKFQFEIK